MLLIVVLLHQKNLPFLGLCKKTSWIIVQMVEMRFLHAGEGCI